MTRRWPTLDGMPTRIIAHRGASGVLPEHTLAAYALALQQGADVIEPDLVMSADGILVIRHDLFLSRSTDVASRPDFAAHRRDGDWWVQDLDWASLRSLRAIQPFAARARDHDGRFPLARFGDLVRWAQDSGQARGQTLCLYPEIKHPTRLADAGLDPVPVFVRDMAALARDSVDVWLQCFEIDALRRVRERVDLPVFLLLDDGADWRAALAMHGAHISGFGASKRLLFDASGAASGLVDAAHAHGLAVHAWTYRDDQLPDGIVHVHEELDAAFDAGVDAVFCDFPATARMRRDVYETSVR